MRLLGVTGVGYDALAPHDRSRTVHPRGRVPGYSDPDTGTYQSDHLDLTGSAGTSMHFPGHHHRGSSARRHCDRHPHGGGGPAHLGRGCHHPGRAHTHARLSRERRTHRRRRAPTTPLGQTEETDTQTAAGCSSRQLGGRPAGGPADSDDLEESFRFHLGSEANTEAVQKLFTAADAADTTVVTAEVYTEGDVDADLELQSLDALEQLDDVFTDKYDALTGFTFPHGRPAPSGLRLVPVESHYSPSTPSIDDVLSAHQQIEDLGASLTSVSTGLREAEVEAPDTGVLRDITDAVSSSS